MQIVDRGGLEILAAHVLRGMEEVAITIPALPRPTASLIRKHGYPVSRIERDTSPECRIDVYLISVLEEGEQQIPCDEYEERLAIICGSPIRNLGLGYQHAQWLVEHQTEFPSLMALWGRMQDGHPVYIDFPGISIWSNGDRGCLYLSPDASSRKWQMHFGLFRRGFYSMGRVAIGAPPGL